MFMSQKYQSTQSIGNPFVGIIFLLVTVILLIVNETGYIKNTKMAKIARKAVHASELSTANNNKLVHIMGELKTDDIVTDGIVSVNALVLSRDVEEYKEVRKKTGNSYSAARKWVSGGQFNYQDNGKDRTISSIRKQAENIRLGPFVLDYSVKNKLKADSDYKDLPRLRNLNLRLWGGMYYVSGINSQIGDVRISYKYLPSNSNYSIIAKQNGNILEPYNHNGTEVLIVREGLLSKEGMISEFANDNKLWTNVKRVIAFVLLFISFSNIITPVRFVFSLLEKDAGMFENLRTKEIFLLTVMVFLGIIALIWLTTSPIMSILIIIITGIICKYIFGSREITE